MKKRLEAELISIAHRILKLKNVSELKQLHLETQKLYETLSVLKFVEENINIIQPTIDFVDVEQKLENSFDKKEDIIAVANDQIVEKTIYELETETIIVNEEIAEDKNLEKEEEILSIANDKIVEKDIIIEENKPFFVPNLEPEKLEVKPEPVQISFDEFKFEEPVFEKKSDIKIEKSAILNEKLVQGINIGLNDKIAFVKHLFGESNEDYIRVLSQINTFDTYYETVNFINDIVKPDYNNWTNKDEYVQRFMEAVEKKFV